LFMSSALFERILLPPHVVAESLGEITLKGKREPVGLVRLSHAGEAPNRHSTAGSVLMKERV
jgi:class 3 adenylate cyclase